MQLLFFSVFPEYPGIEVIDDYTIKFNFDVKEAYYTNLREEKTEDIKVENNTINVKELSHCKFVTICVKAK